MNTLADMFHHNIKPSIFFDKNGHNCIFNIEAEKLFNISVVADIKELFPTIDLNEELENQVCHKIDTEIEYPLNIIFFKETSHWIIEIKDSHETEWDNFVQCQKMLHVLFLDLISINDENDLYKALIIKAKKLLKIDRMGILLYNHKEKTVKGCWGTNIKGEIEDQSSYNGYIQYNDSYSLSLDFRNFIVYTPDTDLYEYGTIVGNGWNTKSTFYAGHKPIGWISCDNLISKKPLPKWKKEILGELSRMTGEFIFNLRLENHLKDEVEKKTIILNKAIKELKETRDNLIQSEKLASLGTLISGVAHEMNTPIGVALTSSSHIEEMTKDILKKIDDSTLKKRDLTNFVNGNLYSSTLAVSSLKKATSLVNIFKQLSADQESNTLEETNVSDIIDNILLTLKYSTKLNIVDISLNIDKNLRLNCNPGNFYQIFTNLINNSLIHGFINTRKPSISITGRAINDTISIDYIDNGIGIPGDLHKKVFEPFYTTKRRLGSTGLGLNIIHNSVLKIGGMITLLENKSKGVHFNIQFKI